MSYRIVHVDLAAAPDPVTLAPEETGLALVLRDGDAIVGFHMASAAEIGPDRTLRAEALVDRGVETARAGARLRAELAPAPPGPGPSITVAICSKDRWEWVGRLLDSIDAVRDDAPLDVLVIENAPSSPRMQEVCEARSGVRYVAEPLVGLDFARNRAIAEARGEVVAFLDDDVIVDRAWLRGLRRAWAENPDAGCVTGLVLPMKLETEAQLLFEAAGGFRRGVRPLRYSSDMPGDPLNPCGAGKFGAGANMSLRRALVQRMGGFDEALDTGRPLPGGGDIDIFYRVLRSGAPLVYEPGMCVFHEHRQTMAQLKHQYYTWGLGFMAYAVKSMRTDPAMRPRFRRLIVWWTLWQIRRLARRLRGGHEPVPAGMILAELRGGIVGLFGEYGRSQRRSGAIRAAAEAS